MQGKLIIGVVALAFSTAAVAGEPPKRIVCAKDQTQQQRQQQPPQQRSKSPECRATKAIPPVVDPTPWFLL
jgi:hypothetical protein